jgi:hypothetical protein
MTATPRMCLTNGRFRGDHGSNIFSIHRGYNRLSERSYLAPTFPSQPTPTLLGPGFDEISRLYAVSKGFGEI